MPFFLFKEGDIHHVHFIDVWPCMQLQLSSDRFIVLRQTRHDSSTVVLLLFIMMDMTITAKSYSLVAVNVFTAILWLTGNLMRS